MEKQVKIMKKKNRKADEIFTKQLKKDILSMVKIDDFKTNYECIGKEMHTLMKKLYPICRSITGDGARKTLEIIKKIIPIEIKEVLTGTKVFDWTVPKEWNIKDAYIKNSKGKKIVDFKKSNLHVLNYSIPVNKKMSLDELKKHLFTIPEHANWIPYRTSYYKENWGFCLTHNQFKKLKEDTYHVVIDSKLEKGGLTYGELYIKGRSKQEVLISTYICHPSLCNDNLSGVVLTTFLALLLKNMVLKYSYRILFIPETIGSITWLAKNEDKVSNIKHGFVVTCVGDSGHMTYKKTRDGNTLLDRIAEKVLIDSGDRYRILDFFPFGSDERQFSSPGFNLPMGTLMRTLYYDFPEYHTSADNLNFVKSEYLADSLEKYTKAIFILENNKTYINLNPKCEPQLGKRGLYEMIGGRKSGETLKFAMLWVLNLSDGKNSLLDISVRSGMKFEDIKKAADTLFAKKLLKIKN
jgi:aminopeptidase-like protein